VKDIGFFQLSFYLSPMRIIPEIAPLKKAITQQV
jgi:hypothetical protein